MDSSAILVTISFPFFSKNKNAYQTDKTCDIIRTALTITPWKSVDARTSQNSTIASHREYHLMAVTRWIGRSLRQVNLSWLSAISQKKSLVLRYEGFLFNTKMLELLNSYLLSHVLFNCKERGLFYVFIIHRLILFILSKSMVDTTFGQRFTGLSLLICWIE